MLRFIVLGVLYFQLTGLCAQEVKVRDRETGQVVPFATVSRSNGTVTAVTNELGVAYLSGIRDSDTIEIRSVGYQSEFWSGSELAKRGYIAELNPSQLTLGQVVVSATRWNQSSREMPEKVVTITPDEVELQNPQTAADLLELSGEVYLQKSQQGGGSPMIRGFSTNRILITVDGVRMNNAIFRSGNLHNVIAIDPLAVDRVEVLFGPGSVIYGSDAIGGVMGFYTLKPVFSRDQTMDITGSAFARYASANNEQTYHADFRLGWKKWALVTSVSQNNFGDLRMGRFGPASYLRPWYVQRAGGEDVVVQNDNPELQVPTAYRQTNLMQKVSFRPDRDWRIDYAFHYSVTGDIPRYDRLIRELNGMPVSAEWKYGPQEWLMNSLTIKSERKRFAYDQFNLQMAQQRFGESRIDRDFGDSLRNIRTEKVNAYSVNLDLYKKLTEGHRLSYGVDVVFNRVESAGRSENILTNSSREIISRYPDSDWSSAAAYLTYQYQPSEKWHFKSGLRYNLFQIQSTFDTSLLSLPIARLDLQDEALTGSIGVVFTPGDQTTISASSSTGFRAPNVDDIGKTFDSEPGSVVVPNPQLDAEYAYNFEVGAAQMVGEWIKVDASVYYTLLQNALVRRNFQLGGRDSIIYDGELSQVQAIQNAAMARVYGIQAGVELNLPYGLGFLSRYNFQQGKEELNDGSTSPSRHAAPAFGRSSLTFAKGSFSFDLYAEYNGSIRADELAIEERGKPYLYAINAEGEPYSPSWYTLNFKGRYEWKQKLIVTVGLENITNQRYRPYSSGIAAPGRNMIISAKWEF